MKSLSLFVCMALLLAAGPASADPRTEELRRCLAGLDAIAWQLPYLPTMQVRSCAAPGASYDTADKPGAGSGSLELIGELTLGPQPGTLDADHGYAALQEAVHAHFDALFRRHGYRRTDVEYGDAAVRRDPNTQRMLQGVPTVPESEQDAARRIASQPPIPFVNLARYVRQSGQRTVTLTYKCSSKNTWNIRIEGMQP